MSLRTLAISVVVGALASACVVVPVTVTEIDECGVVARHMVLQTVQIGEINGCSNQGCQALIIAALGVTAASAIVSGSIVVVGNMAYWAERRTGCPAPLAAPA